MERIKQALERAKRERDSAATVQTTPKSRPAEVRRVEDMSDIEYTKTHIIRPDAKLLRHNRVISPDVDEAIIDSYRMLRTRTLQRVRDNGWNSLMITSPNQSEGKTLTAINLAISMAMEVNHTVLLVDLDLRRPSIHRFFGYEPALGISDYLRGDVELQDVLFNPSIERLVVLPGRERVEHSSELISSPRMSNLVDELKNRYERRTIVFDVPPVLAVDDALALSPLVDSALLVVADGKTQKQELMAAFEVLADTNILGVVLNKAEDRPQSSYPY